MAGQAATDEPGEGGTAGQGEGGVSEAGSAGEVGVAEVAITNDTVTLTATR